MRLFVLSKTIAVCECFFAKFTMEYLIEMVFAVSFQLFLTGKTSFTVIASKAWVFITVLLMLGMTATFTKFPTTLFTWYCGCILLMHRHMVGKTVCSSELFVTDATGIRENTTFADHLNKDY